MTCKDCVHYNMCYLIEHYGADEDEFCDCDDFINKADVVPVVRCKDCRWLLTDDWDGKTLYSCGSTRGLEEPTPDSYCSYGERRCDR